MTPWPKLLQLLFPLEPEIQGALAGDHEAVEGQTGLRGAVLLRCDLRKTLEKSLEEISLSFGFRATLAP